MNEETRAAVSHWLHTQGQRSLEVGMSQEEFGLLKGLIGAAGFGIFWSLLAQQRAEALVALSNLPLTEPAKHAAASVLQGQIRAIDQIRSTVLDIADPQAADAAEPQDVRSE